MNVKVSDLKIEVEKLNSLIEEYENNYLNLYNEFLFSSFFWHDKNASFFYDDIRIDKLKIKQAIEEINSVKDLYMYIAEQYEYIGNKIEYNLKFKDDIIYEFNKYITHVNNIIEIYNNLDISFCPEISQNIINQKNRFIEQKKNIIIMKEKVKNTFNNIENIEKKIKLEISKLDITFIQEKEISKYM